MVLVVDMVVMGVEVIRSMEVLEMIVRVIDCHTWGDVGGDVR